MEPDATTPDAQELLSHTSWIRGLARSLVGESSAADDAVQDTWIAAMRRSPQRRGPMRPWLAGILRRGVLQRRREESRRARRQCVGARPEATPSTAELVERAELQRRVAEAVV